MSYDDITTENVLNDEERKGDMSMSLVQQVQADPVKTLRKLISVTESNMQERIAVWDRHRRKYRRGLKYLSGSMSSTPLYFTNYLYANVESMKANLTKNMPPIIVSPRGFRDDLAADLMTRVLSDSLRRAGLKKATKAVVHNGLLATMAHYKIYFDDEKDGLAIDAIAPEELLIDPKANTDKDGRWYIHRTPNVPVAEIYDTYGVIPQFDDSKGTIRSDDKLADRTGLYLSTGELKPAIETAPTLDVYEAWIRSWEQDRENDWYKVTMSGSTILDEGYSVFDHNQHPFVTWFCIEDFGADNIYHRGVGAIEEIEPLQDRADALDIRINKNISLLSNRQRYISAQSGLNTKAVDNTSGRNYLVNGDPGKAVHYDTPPQLSQEVYQYRGTTDIAIQTVSGMFDVTQGRRPTGITAGRAIESLKDSAETRIADMADSLGDAMSALGDKAIQIVMQFYDGERVLKATDGDKERDFVMLAEYPPELQPQPTPLVGDDGMVQMDPETGEPMMDEEEELEITPEIEQARAEWKEQNGIALVLEDVTYTWDIKADTDSALPSAKAEKSQVAADMFRLGAIDREALLEAVEYPQRHKILQRLAAQVTGKDAGNPDAEAGEGMAQQLMAAFEQMLVEQMGVPQDQAQQLLEAVAGSLEGETQQQPQTGNYQPQMTQ